MHLVHNDGIIIKLNITTGLEMAKCRRIWAAAVAQQGGTHSLKKKRLLAAAASTLLSLLLLGGCAGEAVPSNQELRNMIAEMKQIPVPELIQDKKLLLVDDSIVRGTQLRETVEFLYKSGAKEVHMRSACPPIMYGCKYLNFSRSNSEMELLARRIIQKLEGDEGQKHVAEYADGSTKRGQ